MNASTRDIATTAGARRAPSALETFRMLLRRELWEHRGGFLWAPIVAGIIFTVFNLLGIVTVSVLFQRSRAAGDINFDDMRINDLQGIEAARQLFGAAGDVTLLTGVGVACAVLVFVVFFYALGALYDERKDRSVLFWKSLPLSDTQTVLSKVAWALVLAPALAIGIGLLTGMLMWIVSLLAMLANGIPGSSAIVTESHPFRVLFNMILMIPVYAAWALPTVGWLMLCSAWARSKPFLWAVLVPLLSATLISWLGTLPGLTVPHLQVWYILGYRGLLSIVPGTWYAHPAVTATGNGAIDGPEAFARAVDFGSSWHAFATADLWIGAVVGAAMIFGAIELRRRRELSD